MLPSWVTIVTSLIMWVTGNVWIGLLFPLGLLALIGLAFLIDWLGGWYCVFLDRLFARPRFPRLYTDYKPGRHRR